MLRLPGGRAVAVVALVCGIGCAKQDGTQPPSQSQVQVNIPQVRPPVQLALPQALVAGTTFTTRSPGTHTVEQALTDYIKTCSTSNAGDDCLSLTGTDRLRCHIKQRLFCPGPTEVLSLLNGLDMRTEEIHTRSTGNEPCLTAAPSDRTSDLSFPGSQSFSHYLQCKDTSVGFGFGQKDGNWYLRTGGSVGGWLFSVDSADDLVSGYQWGLSNGGGGSILRIAASKAAGTVEFVGNAAGFCAIHYRSDHNHAWILINESGVGTTCDSNSDGHTDANDYAEICLDATSLDLVDPSLCASLKSGKTLTMIGRGSGASIGQSFEAAATPASEPIFLDDQSAYGTLTQHAIDMTGITEFEPTP